MLQWNFTWIYLESLYGVDYQPEGLSDRSFSKAHDRIILSPHVIPPESVIPRLQQQFGDAESYFQKDGAPPHFTVMWELIWIKTCKTDGLKEEEQSNTDLDHQISWTFLLWGFLKDKVYSRKPETIAEMKQLKKDVLKYRRKRCWMSVGPFFHDMKSVSNRTTTGLSICCKLIIVWTFKVEHTKIAPSSFYHIEKLVCYVFVFYCQNL